MATRRIQALPSLALAAVFGAGAALAVTVGEQSVARPHAVRTAYSPSTCPNLADWNTMVPEGVCPAQS